MSLDEWEDIMCFLCVSVTVFPGHSPRSCGIHSKYLRATTMTGGRKNRIIMAV